MEDSAPSGMAVTLVASRAAFCLARFAARRSLSVSGGGAADDEAAADDAAGTVCEASAVDEEDADPSLSESSISSSSCFRRRPFSFFFLSRGRSGSVRWLGSAGSCC